MTKVSPRLVNMKIFSNIRVHTRSQDVKLEKMHKFLLKNAYPIVRILDSILTSSSSCSSKSNHMLINEIRELVSDALAALSQSNQELLQQRQDGITKYLSKEYKTLKPVTKLAKLISHQITVDITKLSVPTLAETKKTQKTSRTS